jgi:hypothetical protein
VAKSDYSREEPEALWNDMSDLRGRPEDRHDMGALVVNAISDREFGIIDGQPRLVTLSVLTLVTLLSETVARQFRLRMTLTAPDGAAPAR